MTDRQFFQKSIAYSTGALLLAAALILLLDPFVHYHLPFFGLEAAETEERSAMIGVAEHSCYETALIGSSMSENFKASSFNDPAFGTSTVKLCMQGGHFADYDVLLTEVCSHPEVKNIIFSLDNYLLTNNPDEYPLTIPSYLSNKERIDDAYYVLNKSVLLEYLPKFLLNNAISSEDEAYFWANDVVFSEEEALSSYLPTRITAPSEELPFDTFFEFSDRFMASMTPYLQAHPEITFYFYVSPYSMLFWDDCVRRGTLTAQICTLERVIKELLTYENVRIFYFQDETEITCNLNLYKDYSHFAPSVNEYMIACMKTGQKEVLQDTYYDTLLAMYDLAVDYDYDALLKR